jgi:hypothetical protein
MLDLPQITLVLIDTIEQDLAYRVIKHNSKLFNFGEVKFFTDQKIQDSDNIQTILIPKIDRRGYSKFIISELNDYISTEFVLFIQTDGFIVNPHLWNPDFLKYDYIGAPWSHGTPNNRVGNGGFSLRSKKFLQCVTDNILDHDQQEGENINEDYLACCIYYSTMLENGIKFAKVKEAADFSLEHYTPDYPRTPNEVFGVHGIHFKHYLNTLIKP